MDKPLFIAAHDPVSYRHQWQPIQNIQHRMEYSGVKVVFELRQGNYYGYCENCGLDITGINSVRGGGDNLEDAIRIAIANINMFRKVFYTHLLPAVEKRAGGKRPKPFNKIKYILLCRRKKRTVISG